MIWNFTHNILRCIPRCRPLSTHKGRHLGVNARAVSRRDGICLNLLRSVNTPQVFHSGSAVTIPPMIYILETSERWVCPNRFPLLFLRVHLTWVTMTSVLSSGTDTILSTALTSITSSPTPSFNAARKTRLSPGEIVEVVIGSIVFCLLIALILIWVFVLRRSRQKYQHPEDKSKTDSVDSVAAGSMSKSSQDDWHSISKHGGTDPLFTTRTQQTIHRPLVTHDSQYFKGVYAPPSSFVNNYEDREIHRTHVVPLYSAQSQGDREPYRGFETATLLSARPSSLNPPIKLAPLSIPRTHLNHSNGKRSIKRKVSRQKTLDSGLETDDSDSLYSEASASTPHSSTSSRATIVPEPVPPIPLRFTQPTQLTPPDTFVSARRQEEAIIESSPPTTSLFTPLPSIRFNRHEAEAAEDDTDIRNVAKLLHSRQSRLPKNPDPPSRNSSIVSHIERSGSIKPVISPSGEEESESYRPRYHRWKQNRNDYLSASHLHDTSMLPSSHLRVVTS